MTVGTNPTLVLGGEEPGLVDASFKVLVARLTGHWRRPDACDVRLWNTTVGSRDPHYDGTSGHVFADTFLDLFYAYAS